MRISVISAAVCCALFPLISVSAAGLSVEQRLAQLEARLGTRVPWLMLHADVCRRELLVEIGDPVVGSQTPIARLHKI